MKPYVSIVIPVYNEEDVLHTLFDRMYPVLESIGKPYEIIFANDGSRDKSLSILKSFHEKKPKNIRIVTLKKNYGQHMAILAGFEHAKGELVVTLDADCQNPPEEIPKIIEQFEKGHDVIGGCRAERNDAFWRTASSKAHNILREIFMPGLKLKDPGCMLRGYSKEIIERIVESEESATFIPALALHFASNPIDIDVLHEERQEGESHYNFYKLLRYQFDLVTSSSLAPLEFFTMSGITVSGVSILFVIYLFLRRMIVGPEVEGVFTLFAIMFFLIGIVLLGLGIVGEYVGRIYMEVRNRARFVISDIVETSETEIPNLEEELIN